MKELGLSCGTFNPIHNWHLIAGQTAMDQFGLDKVLFIPNGNPPHKKDVLDKELRFEMVCAAIAGNPRFQASRIEVDRTGPSYTLDTLTALKQQYGDGVRLNLIIGVDNIGPIPKWYKADEIFRICRLLIAPRLACLTEEDVCKMAENLPAHTEYKVISEAPSSTVSSTMVREWIGKGRSVQYLVPHPVNQILLSKGHYRMQGASSSATAGSAQQKAPESGANLTGVLAG